MKKKIEDLNSKSKVADLKQHIIFLEKEQCSQKDKFEDFMEKNPQICTFEGGNIQMKFVTCIWSCYKKM